MNDILEKTIGDVTVFGIRVEKDASLAAHSSFRIGGTADAAIFPASEEELVRAVGTVHGAGVPYLVIGNGTNVLFPDEGFRGAVIFTSGLRRTEIAGERVYAECGASFTALAATARDAGLSGLEFAYGIPGTAAGAAVMNAGAYGGETANVVSSVKVFSRRDGRIYEIGAKDMRFAYRTSAVKEDDDLTVLGVTFALERGNADEIGATMADFMRRRREKQPLDLPSAGSVFKRPAPNKYVGKMIEESGLKGFSIGGARVSEKHAGFIVNAGGATAADVSALVDHIAKIVYERYGERLECEIRVVKNE